MSSYRDSNIFKQEDIKWNRNALIGSYFSNDLSFIAGGYYKGANLLVETLEKNPSNILVYPIVFLYRHYIEIQLKAILLEFQTRGCQVNGLHGHNLERLLTQVNTLCNQESLPPVSNHICDKILEFNDFDSTSQTFRYSEDRRGNQNIPEHDTLGLASLKETMKGVEQELYGLRTGLYEENTINQEIAREHNPN